MSSKTKILVIKLKEIIYTLVFVILGIILIVLLILIFSGRSKKEASDAVEKTYSPGVYTASMILSDNAVDIQVAVDKNQIKSIELVNIEESVTTMYPLISASLDDIASQIIRNNSMENITYSYDSKYTSLMLIDTIQNALNKAK